MRDRQSRPSVLIHSRNPLPLGNCDSSRLETCLNYFIRSGAVSHRSSPPGSVFRVTGTRERARGTGEYCLFRPALRLGFGGTGPTSLPRPFPSRLGLSLGFSASILFAAVRPGSFNELGTS